MKHRLADLLDVPALQSLLDSLYASSKIPSAIIDNEGKILTGSGWQDVCTKFHRTHPEAEKRCIESDLYIKQHIHEADPSIVYRCPHGLVDSATPIVVEGEHIGNVFTGQLFLEEPDLEYFRPQARTYGFDEEEYIEAVKKVPVIPELALRENLLFIVRFTELLAEMGLNRLREKEAEKAREATIELLRSSEERYRSLFENMTEGLAYCRMMFDGERPLDFVYLDVNGSFGTLTGLKDVVGKKVTEVIPGIRETDPRLFEIYGRVASTGNPERFEIYVEALGDWFDISVYSPKREYFVALFDVITRRKRSEETLQEATRRLQLAATSGHFGIWEWDIRSGALLWDDKMFELYGGSRDTFPISFEAWKKRLHPGDRTKAMELTEAVLRGEKEYDTEFRVVLPDGKERFIKANALVLRDADGKATRMIGLNSDITGHRSLEDQLRQSQRMEAVGRLAGGIAHDFNNLLTVINGYSELLLHHVGDKSPLRKDLEEIKRAGDRAATLTRQLLAFSRRQVIQPKVLDLNAVVSEMDTMLRRLIGEDIEFRILPGNGLGTVKGDPGQLEQVIVNLVVNARDAMPGGGRLTIETANVFLDEDFSSKHPSVVLGPHVLLAVSDTGEGMNEDTQAHMFEPFFTTKEKGKGTGLGLSTVYGIVQQSRGHIDVHSEVGKGTTVKMFLPRVDGAVHPLSSVSSTVPQGSETVLVVEDEPSVREFVERVLSGKGYRVLSAGEGTEGLRVSGEYERPIDLLLTDVVMPGMGGRELATRLEVARPGMNVLFMSGYTEDAISHRGVLDDGLAFVQKPFTSDALLRKVRETLDRRR